MSSPVNTLRQVSINQLIETFQTCLLALIPHVEAVGLSWRDGEAYDDWERIELALFQSIVSTPVEFTPSEGASQPLPRYQSTDDPAKCSLLFDEALGEAYAFFTLEQTSTPFDTARFQPDEGEDVCKPIRDCQFRVRLRASRSADTEVIALTNIG